MVHKPVNDVTLLRPSFYSLYLCIRVNSTFHFARIQSIVNIQVLIGAALNCLATCMLLKIAYV